MPHGVLTPDEIARRIRAARELRQLSQTELGRLLKDDGLGLYDAARIERGEMPMTRAHRDALIRHLRVPERWFTAEDVDEIVGLALSLEEAAQQLGPLLLAAAQELRTAEAQAQQDEAAPDRMRTSLGGST